MDKTIKQIIIERDGISSDEADDLIKEAREQLSIYLDEGEIESAENICQEYFGLEPDYIFELM